MIKNIAQYCTCEKSCTPHERDGKVIKCLYCNKERVYGAKSTSK